MSYNDVSLRNQLPADCAALLAEYERCTKHIIKLDHMRCDCLHRLAQRDISPDDMFTVIRYVRKRIRAGDNKRGIGMFKECSLEFSNLLGDVGKFQDRLHTARLELTEKRRKGTKLVTVVQDLGGGETISRLDTAPDRAAEPVRLAVANALRALITNLETA